MQAVIGNYAVPILEDKTVWGTNDDSRTAYMDTQVDRGTSSTWVASTKHGVHVQEAMLISSNSAATAKLGGSSSQQQDVSVV
jgi:hypothetical protein